MTQLTKRCITGLSSKVTAILGSQWGDEGNFLFNPQLHPQNFKVKGSLLIFSQRNMTSVVDLTEELMLVTHILTVKITQNLGHTVVVKGNKYAFHLLPCGILYDSCVNLLGNGVVVHIPTMLDELKQLDRDNIDYKGRLLISNRAHLVLNSELEADAASESKAQPGNFPLR